MADGKRMVDMSQEPCGVLVVDKPQGFTSFDVVGKVRRLYGTRRVGHTGTLDPLATGVLVVLVGRAAKASEYLAVHDKSYRAVMKLGITTDTEDIEGRVLSCSECLPGADAVISAAAGFCGEIMQTPPMYSALKVGGQKLCDLARKGQTVERQARPVTIHSIICEPLDALDGRYMLDVSCSSGTYIRTLCADIGAALGCGGVMAELRRTSVGNFTLADANTPEELENMTPKEREARLLPVESLFTGLRRVVLPGFFERLFRSGCEIYQKKLGTSFTDGERLRVCSADGSFFALGEVFEYPGGSAIRSVKIFCLDQNR